MYGLLPWDMQDLRPRELASLDEHYRARMREAEQNG